MTSFKRLASVKTLFILLSIPWMFGCATGHIDPKDRDTSGQYDGVWIGKVDGPRASQAILPGNWTMSCEWDPFEIYLVVDDGRIQLGRMEYKTPVSTKGDFRLDIDSGSAGMHGGEMSGNAKNILVFSGNLAGQDPRGQYRQYINSLGGYGCNATIRFERESA